MQASTRRGFGSLLGAGGLALAGGVLPAALGGLLFAPGASKAQAAPVAGRDYITLAKPIELARDGRIHVVEFFWYGCPHCDAFEASLAPWMRALPEDVEFHRVPYGFDDPLREQHQRVFCTLQALGLAEALHAAVFDRFHRQRQPIDTRADMLAFARDMHLDPARVGAAWDSFGVATRMRQVRAECAAWGVDFVPVLGVQGRFLVRPRTDADGRRALAAADTLIDRVRKTG